MNYVESIILLFIVIDPFGNIPFVLALLQSCTGRKYQLIIARELLISFAILLLFFWQGDRILEFLNIEQGSLNIAGGVILFIISLKMIFGNSSDLVSTEGKDDPIIVPIAIPSIAGPSAITVMMLLKSHSKLSLSEGTICLSIVMVISWLLFAISRLLVKLLGDKGMNAIARFMGMILIIFSINMILAGVKEIIKELKIIS